ncbi:hypothetical protein B0I35DRAFT_487642 [Stachybotrys elegans]|uniref:Uncharacterized protein n=1 Tax=Stachybotrys elegans TaxID=80388 RepID=A0A8K0T396_9HYPO|nr:hypothetical protein B0I35DRAFT_487642 [Stachybotrys elegans]
MSRTFIARLRGFLVAAASQSHVIQELVTEISVRTHGYGAMAIRRDDLLSHCRLQDSYSVKRSPANGKLERRLRFDGRRPLLVRHSQTEPALTLEDSSIYCGKHVILPMSLDIRQIPASTLVTNAPIHMLSRQEICANAQGSCYQHMFSSFGPLFSFMYEYQKIPRILDSRYRR